jgi:hypothetical protein
LQLAPQIVRITTEVSHANDDDATWLWHVKEGELATAQNQPPYWKPPLCCHQREAKQ